FKLLKARHRYDEALLVLGKAPQQAATDPDLRRDAAVLSLLRRDPEERTRELLTEAVGKDSKDYRDQLFLGQVLWSLDNRKYRQEAEGAFRSAVKLEPKAPEAWVALVTFLAATDRKMEAEEEIGHAKDAVPAQDAALALAACYEAVEKR